VKCEYKHLWSTQYQGEFWAKGDAPDTVSSVVGLEYCLSAIVLKVPFMDGAIEAGRDSQPPAVHKSSDSTVVSLHLRNDLSTQRIPTSDAAITVTREHMCRTTFVVVSFATD